MYIYDMYIYMICIYIYISSKGWCIVDEIEDSKIVDETL